MLRYTTIFLLILLAACQQKTVRIPDEVIKEDKMVEIIKDLQLLEAAHKDMGLFGTEKQNVIDTSYAIVFTKYEVKASEFDSSLSFYSKYPKLYQSLMEKVGERLSVEEL